MDLFFKNRFFFNQIPTVGMGLIEHNVATGTGLKVFLQPCFGIFIYTCWKCFQQKPVEINTYKLPTVLLCWIIMWFILRKKYSNVKGIFLHRCTYRWSSWTWPQTWARFSWWHCRWGRTSSAQCVSSDGRPHLEPESARTRRDLQMERWKDTIRFKLI